MYATRKRQNVEYRAVFTLKQAGSSVAWQRTCFGTPEAVCGVGSAVLSAIAASEKPPIIV